MAGAPTVVASIYADADPDDADCPTARVGAARADATLRLLQLDIAVRDPDATQTGWVFGTFIYDGRIAGADPWAKLRPVGLTWGNDPGLADGSSGAPTESIVLSDFGLGRAFGREGRMNGPVDNPRSSCTSCHMSAKFPSSAGLTPPGNAPWAQVRCWFRNLPPNQAFERAPTNTVQCDTLSTTRPEVSLDYSLQMTVGLRNHAAETRSTRVTLFGLPLYTRRANVDEMVRIDGARTFPVTREGAPME